MLPVLCFGQNSEAYTDEDLQDYLKISSAMYAHQTQAATYAKRMQEELQISEEDMGQTMAALKKAGSWEKLKPQLDTNYASRFNELMTYRASLKQRMRQHLQDEMAPYDWNEDKYQHFKLTLEVDPDLQARLIKMSKEQE